jgi:hypothetical protein
VKIPPTERETVNHPAGGVEIAQGVRMGLALVLLLMIVGAVHPAESAGVEGAMPPDSAEVVPPKDLMDVVKHLRHGERIEPEVSVQSRSGIAYTILPTATYNPVFGFAFGASVSGAGRRGTGKSSRISSFVIGGNYSTTGQVQAYVRGDVFSGSESYLWKGDVRYLDTNRSTWGLGPRVDGQSEYPMDFKQGRAYLTLYRHISGPVYSGIGYHYDEYFDIRDERAVAGETTPYTSYSGGMVERAIASGYSINLLGDTRDNPVNAGSGFYLSANMRNYVTGLGSDKNWQEMWAEFRAYPHVPGHSRNPLGFWIYSWFTFGTPPYLGLPAIGGDTYARGGRGYLQGRIRGRNQLYFETEYRMQLTRDGLLGAVLFLNLMGTTVPESQTFGRTDKGGGVGLRVKLNKRSNTNLTVDAGWGEHSSAKWFFGATEVF